MPSANSSGPKYTTSSSSSHPKPFSISLPTSKPKPTTQAIPNSLNPKKRPHSSLTDSDSENDTATPAPQLVSSFDHSAGGAIGINGVEKVKAPLVIQRQKNRDWREESRRKRGKNLLPAEVQAARLDKGSTAKDFVQRDDASRGFGLTFVKKGAKDGYGDIAMVDAQINTEPPPKEPTRPRTEDEEAMEALMGNGTKKSTLVLPALGTSDQNGDAADGRFTALVNEDDSFRSDVASRPDSASLEEYAAVPVEDFGAALLRGMGWKEGDVVGKRKDQISKARTVTPRPALLGIGAKEVPGGVGDELGAWGKVTGKGKRKIDQIYNPVLLRNSKTGELLTEEELEAKQEECRKEELDWRERRDRNLAADEDKKAERRHRDKNRLIEESRHSSPPSKRARSRSPSESRHHRQRSRSADRKKQHTTSSSSSSSRRRDRSRSADRSRHSSKHNRSRSRDRNHDSRRRRDGERDRESSHRARDRRKNDTEDGGSDRSRYKDRDGFETTSKRKRQEVF